MTYPPTLHGVTNGEPVNEEITNRPINELDARTNYLKSQLDSIERLFEVLTLQDRPVGDSVLENQIVYFDQTTEKLEPAVAELESAGSPPVYSPTDRTFLVGLAQNIRGAPGGRICDLRLSGLVEALDFTNLLETTDPLEIGKPYWLTTNSGEAGRISLVRPTMEYLVGVFMSETEFRLLPQLKHLGEDHVHYTFNIDYDDWEDLGPATSLTGSLTFTAGSSTVTGAGTAFLAELNAGSAIMLDADEVHYRVDSVVSNTELILTIPYAEAGGSGAATKAVGPFLIDEAKLSPFPPIPFESAEVSLNGHILRYGVDFEITVDGLNYLAVEYPPTKDMFEMKMWYTLPMAGSSPGVTRLISATPNVIIENCFVGGPDDVGELKVSVIPVLETITSSQAGSLVVKDVQVDSDTGDLELSYGQALEKIVAGPGISISPSSGQGTVTITATTSDVLLEEIPEILLQNAKQSLHNLTPYIELPENQTAAFIGKIRLPDTLNTSENLKFIFECIGESSTVNADTVMWEIEYYFTSVALNESINKPKLVLRNTTVMEAGYTAYDSFTITVIEIPGTELIAGSILSFSLKRLESLDTYEGNIGILTPRYRVKLT